MSFDDFERRRAERKRSLNFIDCVVIDARGEVVGRELGRTLNLSLSGLLLDTPVFVDPGSAVRVTLSLGEEMLELKGRLAHISPGVEGRYCAGVEFVGLDAADRKRLRDFLGEE